MENPISKCLNQIAEVVPKVEKGDYIGGDGLWYCGRCHTPKQCKVIFCGKEQKFPVVCTCKKAEIDKKEAEWNRKKEADRREAYRKTCFSNKENLLATIDADDRRNSEVSDAVVRYIENWKQVKADGMGILFYGPVGTGKSFYAGCIANALIDRTPPVPVLMTNFVRIIHTMQGMYEGKQDYIDWVVNFPLLILDDLGAERQNEYMLEQVYNIIDLRYQTGKPLIVTTNIPIAEIKNPNDISYQRIYSRLLQMCQPVKVDGNDRRRDFVKEQYSKRNNILGLGGLK